MRHSTTSTGLLPRPFGFLGIWGLQGELDVLAVGLGSSSRPRNLKARSKKNLNDKVKFAGMREFA